jgi:hypothetical protein
VYLPNDRGQDKWMKVAIRMLIDMMTFLGIRF